MKFIVESHMARLPEDEFARFIGSPEHLRRAGHHIEALNRVFAERAAHGSGNFVLVSIGMGPPAETATIRNGANRHTVTDGPFAETKELLAGFDLIDFASDTEAIEFARNEHVRDADHLMVVRRIERMWWINRFRARTAADFNRGFRPADDQQIFALSIFARGNDQGAAQSVTAHVARVGADYLEQRGAAGDQMTAWCGARFTPQPSAVLRISDGRIAEAGSLELNGGNALGHLLLAAFRSFEEAADCAAILLTPAIIAIEVRPTAGFFWNYLD
jgi:hypothetical protein